MHSNKVTISGVNTAALKTLTEKEKQNLLLNIKNNVNPKQAREKLITGNLKLVLSVIQKFANQKENIEDLFQVGCIGLIKAIDRFDTSHKVQFSTYAVPMIQGELKRYLRDHGSIKVSRSLKYVAYRIMKIKEQYTNKFNREPSISEIEKELNETSRTISLALDSIVEPISLNEPIYNDSSDAVYVMDLISNNSTEQNWINEFSIKKAVAELSDREKKILSLRFLIGQTQTEVAAEIGISQAQVSRLEQNALNSIRSQLN